MRQLRTVLRSHRFEEEASRYASQASDLESAIVGLEWVLARLAEHGMAAGDSGLDSWPIHTGDGQVYRVFYRYDRHQVELVSILRLKIRLRE